MESIKAKYNDPKIEEIIKSMPHPVMIVPNSNYYYDEKSKSIRKKK